jgi:hypothetical protein
MTETPKPETQYFQDRDDSKARHKASQAARAAAQEARLKAALRDNLRRRKVANQDD